MDIEYIKLEIMNRNFVIIYHLTIQRYFFKWMSYKFVFKNLYITTESNIEKKKKKKKKKN